MSFDPDKYLKGKESALKSSKDVTCMVVDYGLFVEVARVLGRTFKKVYVCNPSWPSPFPKMNQGMIGYGFPEIEVCLSPYDHYDEVDLYVFLDVGLGAMQDHLRKMGKAVWGAGMAEDLEFERDMTKELMKKLGLPVGPYKKIHGLDALREYLKTKKDQYIKINRWRGHFETMKAKNLDFIEPKLDEIEAQFGKLKNMVDFIVEDELKDKFEVAIDQYTVDGEYPSKMLYGVEVKDMGYIGLFTDRSKIAKELLEFDAKFAPIQKKYGARTFLSAETRIGKDRKAYMIDICERNPSPPNEIYQVEYTNLAEIMWQGANGIMIDPIPKAKWVAEIIIHSSWASTGWQPVQFPKSMEPFVKLRSGIRIDGKFYTMPQVGELPEIGAVVGYGNSMEEAMDMAKEVGESVEGYSINIPEDSLSKATEQIELAKEYGVWIKE